MRLTTLELHRFGKFKNEIISLPSGLYMWQARNESGKTTVADFIRFMFYGFEKSRAKRPLAEDPLQKYQPWDSGEGMAGALELIDDAGRSYRLERTLSDKGKGTLRVLDGEGRELDVAAAGEHFLGVDGETFVNVFYIRQGSNAPHRTAGMDVAMKNLVTTGSEEISIDRVMKFLQTEKGKYSSPKRGMGRLKNLQEEREELERAVCYGDAALAQKREQLRVSERTEEQIRELTDRLSRLQEEREKLVAHEAFLREQKRAALREQIGALEARLTPLPASEETGSLYEAFRQLERAEMREEQATEELAALQQRAVTVEPRHETVLTYQQMTADSAGKGFAIVGALLAVGGAVGAAWRLWMLAFAAAGAVLLLLGLLRMRLPKALRELGIRNKMQLLQALQQASEATRAAEAYEQALTAARENCRRSEDRKREINERYLPLMQRTGITSLQQLETLQRAQAERRGLEAGLEQLEAQLRELPPTAAEDARIAREHHGLQSSRQLEEQMRQAEQQKEALLRRLAAEAALAEQVRREEARLQELVARKEQCTKEYERCAYLNEVAVIAIDAMEKAQQQLRDNYVPALREKVERWLGILTDGKYDTVTLDEEFAMRIKADGGLRALDYFSQGTREAAYLALRLALAQIVQGEHRIPLIFDDPFLNFDEARSQSLAMQLQALAREHQILYFTCR